MFMPNFDTFKLYRGVLTTYLVWLLIHTIQGSPVHAVSVYKERLEKLTGLRS